MVESHLGRKIVIMLDKPRLTSALAALLTLNGCGANGTSVQSASKGTTETAARTVRIAKAKREPIERAVEATGTLAARERLSLAMQVSGRLLEVNADLGDRVHAGQTIARIDPTDLRIAVDQAAAALHQARTRLGLPAEGTDEKVVPEQTPTVRQASAALIDAKLRAERAQKLFDQQLIPRSDLDTALATAQIAASRHQDAIDEIRNRQALLAQRRAELEMARQQLSYALLKAPADGAVTERLATPGQYVASGAPVISMIMTHPLRLRLVLPERAAGQVRVGQRVRVRPEQDDRVHSGVITRLSPAIEESSRTLLVEAEVANPDGWLRPGAFVRAEVMLEPAQQAVFVPASALITFAGIERVMTVVDGKTKDRTIRTGYRDAQRVEVVEGIGEGEVVVVRPGNLASGQPVRVERAGN